MISNHPMFEIVRESGLIRFWGGTAEPRGENHPKEGTIMTNRGPYRACRVLL